eukprot:m51a1_g4351 hypothetical protein (169) ;mRNA; r:217682-220494
MSRPLTPPHSDVPPTAPWPSGVSSAPKEVVHSKEDLEGSVKMCPKALYDFVGNKANKLDFESEQIEVSDNDPGMVIDWSFDGLVAHAKMILAGVITAAGMTPVDGRLRGTSLSAWVGSLEQFFDAQFALVSLPWARHNPHLPDVGMMYQVVSRGSQVHVVAVQGTFNV